MKRKIKEVATKADITISDELIRELDDDVKNCGAYVLCPVLPHHLFLWGCNVWLHHLHRALWPYMGMSRLATSPWLLHQQSRRGKNLQDEAFITNLAQKPASPGEIANVIRKIVFTKDYSKMVTPPSIKDHLFSVKRHVYGIVPGVKDDARRNRCQR